MGVGHNPAELKTVSIMWKASMLKCQRKVCPFSGENAPAIDYKDTRLLQRYISERGKIVPSRITASYNFV